MSNASPTRPLPVRAGAKALQQSFAHGVQFVSFWAAVALPFVYLPLLFVRSWQAQVALVALIVVHAIFLIVGREYDPASAN
jgi:hypothetical protein